MSATLWRACLDFSTPEDALSDSGSVALTPISAYTFTLPSAHSQEGTNNVPASAHDRLGEKVCDCEKV